MGLLSMIAMAMLLPAEKDLVHHHQQDSGQLPSNWRADLRKIFDAFGRIALHHDFDFILRPARI